MSAIEISGLTKAFRTHKKHPGISGAVKGLFHRQYEQTLAVNEVSFKIEPGELVGFLGPNGAGKTTTLKMLAGLLYPTSGSAKILGHTPWERHDDYRRQFALVLGQKNQLWWDLPARESLELNAKIYDIPKDRFEHTVGEMTILLGVKDKLNVNVRELSLGERMKMELIASLLHQPKILFLDEPTIGLDVTSQKTVRDFIRRHNAEQKTTIILLRNKTRKSLIFKESRHSCFFRHCPASEAVGLLTSHYMADIQELCERVIIIDHGKIFFDGKLSDIVDRFADFKLVTIQCARADTQPVEKLSSYGEVIEKSSTSIKLKVKRDRVIAVCKALLDELPVRDIDIQEVPIEDVIRQIFAR